VLRGWLGLILTLSCGCWWCCRYLYDLCGQDAKVLNEWMTEFEATGKLTITGTAHHTTFLI
jgi:hypothetical protein